MKRGSVTSLIAHYLSVYVVIYSLIYIILVLLYIIIFGNQETGVVHSLSVDEISRSEEL